jgi:Tfp pilus assembly protein PilZ
VVTPRQSAVEQVSLEILDLEDRTPIGCQVRWAMPWGTSRRSLPGWGVAIESIKDSQRTALEKLLREAPQAVI